MKTLDYFLSLYEECEEDREKENARENEGFRVNVILRPFQQEAYEAWKERGFRGTIIAPTGTGKTIIAGHAIKTLGEPTLVICPTERILKMWRERLREKFGLTATAYYGGEKRLGRITVSIYNTVAIHHPEIVDRFSFIVLDEVHHVASEVFQRVLRLIKPEHKVMALTATLRREDERHNQIKAVIPVVYCLDLAEAMKRRLVAPVKVIPIPVSMNRDELREYSEIERRIGRMKMAAAAAREEDDRKRLEQEVRKLTNMRRRILSRLEAKKEAVYATLTVAALHYLRVTELYGDDWAPDEMLHLKWRPDKKLKYSRGSFLEPLRRDWRRLQLMEDSLAVARMVRAYLRYVHYLDATGKSKEEAEKMLREYKRQLSLAKMPSGAYRQRPLEVDSDLFVATGYLTTPKGDVVESLTKIEAIDPRNTGLAEIGDIEHIRRKLFNRVPAEIVGIRREERDITQQDVAFSRLIQFCQYEVLGKRLIKPVLDKALALKGYDPTGAYELIFPDATVRMSWRFADAFFRTSMAFANYREMGLLSNKWVAQRVFNLSDEEWEAIQKDAAGDPPIDRSTPTQQARLGQKSA